MDPEDITIGEACGAIVYDGHVEGQVIDADVDITSEDEAEAFADAYGAERITVHYDLREDKSGIAVTLEDHSKEPFVALLYGDEIHVVPHNTLY